MACRARAAARGAAAARPGPRAAPVTVSAAVPPSRPAGLPTRTAPSTTRGLHKEPGLPASHAAYLTGHTFFPSLISAPFQHGLDIAFDFAIVACLVAAVASLLRGRRYVHEEHGQGREDLGVTSGDDDLEGRQGGVLRIGDPAAVGRHLAQRR